MAVPLLPVPVPRALDLGPFRLTVLTVDDVDADFEAVTESADLLAGLFGDDWPVGLTLRRNLADLGWHEVEFQRATSFAFGIRDRDGRYVGCAYLKPVDGAPGALHAPYWFRASVTDRAALDGFDRAWRAFADGLGAAPVTVTARTRPTRT